MALTLEDFEGALPDESQQDNELATGDPLFDAMAQQNGDVTPTMGKHDKVMAGQAAMIAGVPGDPSVLHQVLMSEDTRGKRQEATAAHYLTQQAELNEYVNTELHSPGTIAQDIANTAFIEGQRISARSMSTAATEQAYVEQAAPRAQSTLRDEVAFNMKAYNILQDLAASQGWMDTAADFAGLVIPLALTKDTSDAADLINQDPELARLAGPDLEAIAMNFQALDAQTKELVFPRIVELIKEATKTSLLGLESEGNITQAVGLLQSFLSSDAGERISGNRVIDVGLSTLDIPGGKAVGMLSKIGKMGAKDQVAVGRVLKAATEEAIRKNNPVNLAKQAGDETAAATHATTAIRDPELAESMNISQADAALSAMPVETNQWMSGVVDGMSAAMAKQLDQDMQRAMGFTRSMTTERQLLQVGAIKDSDRKLATGNFMARMERKGEDYLTQNIQMENLKIVDEAEDGFTYEYTLRRGDEPVVSTAPVREVAEDAPGDAPVADALVATTRVTKTKAGSTLIHGDPAVIRKALKDAGLPQGAVNKSKGESFVSLSGHLYDDVVTALSKANGVDLGKPTASASQKVKARAAAEEALLRGITPQQGLSQVEAATPQYQKITGKVKFTINDVTGTYDATADALTENLAKSYVTAPSNWAKGDALSDFNEAVTDSIISSDIGAGAQAFADDFLKWTVEPLKGFGNTKARARLDAVLLHGDEYINEGTAIKGRTFTPQELADGFDIPGHKGKVRLTSPGEVTAYYRARMFADAMYQMENHAMRRQAELQGLREIRIGGDVTLARPYEDVNAAAAAMRQKPGYAIFDSETREILDFSDDMLRKKYEEGYKLTNTKQSYNTTGGGLGDEVGAHVDYVLVKEANIRDLPAQMLHYKHGYVPKMNKIEYMVKMDVAINKPGEPGARGTMAMRGFNSLMDAKAFRDEQIAKYIAGNPGTTYEQAAARFSIGGATEVGAMERIEKGLGASGGMYTGMRSQNDLLYGLDGQRMARIGALEAFQRQTAHVGTLFSRNEMRLAQEKRWLNTVADRLPSVRITGFESTALPDNAVGRALQRMRQQIKEWNGIPEVEETRMQAAVQYLHDWMLTGTRKLGFQSNGSYQSLQYLKHANPVTAVKAAVMHTLLGALNPAQLYTQASAALIAATRRYGVSLTGDIGGDLRAAFTFGILDNIRHEGALGKALNTFVSKQGIDPRVAEAYQAFRRTGLYESALNNADTAKLSVDGLGATMSVLRKADTASLLFYRAGELFNRRYSFIKEFAAWRAANPKAVVDDKAIIAITKEANKDMLELNAANRAWWQGGNGTNAVRQIAGMATQFLQVTTKTVELLAPAALTGRSEVSGFTAAQKMRVFGGQLFLFGAAGVPLGNMAVNGILNLANNVEVGNQEALAINQGFVGWTVNNMLGLGGDQTQQLDVAQRVALGNQLTEFLRGVMTSDDPLIYAALGPAGGTTGTRVLDAMRELRILYLGSKADAYDLSGEDILFAIREIGGVTSTGNNLIKAYLMHNMNKVLDRRRNTVDEREYDFGTEMGVAFGFRPSIETTTRMVQAANRKFDELVTEAADLRVKLMHKAIFEHRMEPDKVEAMDKAIQVMDEAIDNEELRQAVRDEVDKRLWAAPKSAQDRAISDWLKRVAVSRMGEDARIDMGLGFGVAEQAVTKPFSAIMQEE